MKTEQYPYHRSSRKRRERQRVEGVLEHIIAENFPNLGKETDIEIQEAQRTPFRRNLNQSSAQHIIVKLAKYKIKRILKAARDKCALTYKDRHIRVEKTYALKPGKPEGSGRKYSM